MNESITYQEFQDPDFDSLLIMSQKLWKDVEEAELDRLLKEAIESEKYRIWTAKSLRRKDVGFAVFSIRTDYVEGASGSPTGYLEGIYVEQEYRSKGIAKDFIKLGEDWCKKNGCTQLGSDTWLSDVESRNFHKKLGFWEEDELVHFLKNID